MSYLGESFCDDWNIGVGAFGRGSAYLLIGTAGACIALTGFLGFRTWAVLWGLVSGCILDRLCGRIPGSGATRLGATLDENARDSSAGSSTKGAISDFLYTQCKLRVARLEIRMFKVDGGGLIA